MSKQRYFLFLILCFGFFTNAKATHNRAGEITYKWISGFTYEIKLTTYTNIGGSNLADRCVDTIYFGDGTGAAVLRSNGPCSGACSPACEGQPLPGGTIKLNEYVTTHTYPGPGNYKISMEDPNRNAGVINIPNSVNQVFYVESYLVIPAFGIGKNNSPILAFPPIDNGCVGKCFYHNSGAYDVDGDSLSFELTTSRGHLGVTCPGYTYPAVGSGGIFQIDSLTGTLQWCNPQMQGAYNVAILIKEWRKDDACDYFFIGSVLRDLQVDVGPCSNNLPVINPVTDIFVMAGTIVSKTITANDPDPDVLTMQANGGPFGVAPPMGTFSSPVSLTPANGVFNWQTTFAHARREPYLVTIKVKDNDPTVSLVHFKTFAIQVIHNPPLNLSISTPNNHILLNWNKQANYNMAGSTSFLQYNIYRKDGASNWVHSSNETVPPPYTGFTLLGSNFNDINDTIFHDYNSGNPFVSGLDYSYVVVAQYSDCSSSYASDIFSSQIFVGIKEQALTKSDIQTLPNPVNDDLLIVFNYNSHEAFRIELMDITGRNIKTLTSEEYITKENTIPLNLENINPGIYFLKITGNQHTTITKKIIKQ